MKVSANLFFVENTTLVNEINTQGIGSFKTVLKTSAYRSRPAGPVMPNSFVIDCVCCVVWACLNVLCWHGPPAGKLPVSACVGGILLATGVVRTQGVVRSLLATGTVLESTAGMFLRIRSDFEATWDLVGPREDQL